MKNKSDLVTDVFGDETTQREESLLRSLAFMRKRARQQKAIRTAGGVGLTLVAAGLALWHLHPNQRSPTAPVQLTSSLTPAAAKPPTVPGTDIRLLTDDELLNLFPGRAVAILGTGNERQLVFLDEQRHRQAASVN